MTETGKYAVECLIDCLESYMEFVDIVKHNYNLWHQSEQFVRQMNTICTRRKQYWQPVLDKLKQDIKTEQQ